MKRTFLDEHGKLQSGVWIPGDIEHIKAYRIGAIVPFDGAEKRELIFDIVSLQNFSRRTSPIELTYTRHKLQFPKDSDDKTIAECLLNYDMLYAETDTKNIKVENRSLTFNEACALLQNDFNMRNITLQIKDGTAMNLK